MESERKEPVTVNKQDGSDYDREILKQDDQRYSSEAITNEEQVDSEANNNIRVIQTINNNNNRGKITHRSQSSPSSLTTHKFGLRPTPSPPRLIIDHNTGDIIESYPDQPVYLKTYQPLEDQLDNSRTDEDCTLDDSLAHPYPPPLLNQSQLDEYNRLLDEQYGRPSGTGGYITNEELVDMMSNQSDRNSYRPIIPPPHSAAMNKVYFAAPESSAHHLFNDNNINHQNHTMADPYDSDHQLQLLQQQQQQQRRHHPAADYAGGYNQRPHGNALTSGQQEQQVGERNRMSGSHNNSFKRALNKLNANANTDIAIMTDLPLDYGDDDDNVLGPRASSTAYTKSHLDSGSINRNSASTGGGGGGGFKVTATSASRGNALLAQKKQQPGQQQKQSTKQSIANQTKLQQLQHQQQQHQQPHRILPAIEDFNLYDFCFNFRILLACLISGLIIYLLAYPLNVDCTQYRPTYTYISIIVSSVNLTCIVIFTLFWYCSGVTRTLYANLSSSAFIITIYSILVAINLSLAILFFFINPCHFQKLIKTPSPTPLAIAKTASTEQPNVEPFALPLRTAEATERLLAIESKFLIAQEEYGGPPAERVATARLKRNQLVLPTTASSMRPPPSTVVPAADSDTTMTAERGGGGEKVVGQRNHNNSMRHSSVDSTETNRKSQQHQVSSGEPRFRRRPALDEDVDSSDESAEAAAVDHSLDGSNHRSGGGGGGGGGGLALAQELHPAPIDYYSESPIEVAWDYCKEQLVTFKRKFYQFLMQYDLRFIGALHALCAICLQYMAMKVAVVRSYFCSPVSAYI